jgi:hypothetical protein
MQNYKKLYIDGAFTLGEFQIDRVEEMSGPFFLTGLPGGCAGPGGALADPEALR